MSDPYVGEIRMFAGTFAPRGYALCDGQLLLIADNAALFSLLGTTFGGDGRTTFGIPDLRGRAPIHFGSGPGLTPRTIGSAGGAEQVAVTTPQLPAHTHTWQASGSPASETQPQDNVVGGNLDVDAYAPSTSPTAPMATSAITSTGSSQPHQNMQPYLVINYIIALVGTFPSRS